MLKDNKVALAIVFGLYLICGTLDYATQTDIESPRAEVQA